MPFGTKAGKYVSQAKHFIGKAYGQGKLLVSKFDGSARTDMDLYSSVPVLQALSDFSGGDGKGHLKQLRGGVYSGANEYERLRSQVASRGAAVEQAATTVGGAVESSFGKFM